MKFFLVLLIIVPLFSFSYEINNSSTDNLSKKEVTDLSNQYPHSDTGRLLNELENYDSYRPSSSTDTTRNPFLKKRYKFDLEDDN